MAVSPNTVTSADVQNFIIGGGGADVGALVQVMQSQYADVPAVGDATNTAPTDYVSIIAIGSTVVVDGTPSGYMTFADFAVGTTLTTYWMPAFGDPTLDAAYAFLYTSETTVDEEGFDVERYTSVTVLPDVVTMETNENSDKRYTFTVPEVEEGTHFAVNFVANWD